MDHQSKIYIAGHTGLVGSAIVRKLKNENFVNLIMRTSKEVDLTRQQNVENFFKQEKPDYVFIAAAKVGGIHANNTYRAEFIYENLIIEANIINSAYMSNVKKLLFLGSSCIYPKFAPQPIKEEYFMSGKLEETNEPYAIAKIAGIKLCENYNYQYKTNFISAMPTNLYGPYDNFHSTNSHVLPALIRRIYEAKVERKPEVIIWGTGKPLREFLFIDDLADALLFLMQSYNSSGFINIGTGEEITIKELAVLIKEIVGYKGRIAFDTSKLDGTPRKLLDITMLNDLGWSAKTSLRKGIKITYKFFTENYENIRRK